MESADCQRGRRVRVIRGPLRGVEGILLADGAAGRLVVGITLLQRAVSVVIDRDWSEQFDD